MIDKSKGTRSPWYILLPLSVMLLLVLVLAACGGQANSTQAAAPAANDSQTNTGDVGVNQPEGSESEAEPAPTEEMAEPTAEMVEEEPAAAGLSFAADVFPIIQSRCVNCHGGDRTEAELVLRTYDDLMAGGESGAVIVPGDAANSLLVQLITELKMPKRGPKLTPPQIQLITDWVNQGALNN